MPYVSIIIPVYNAGPYIEACMASLVAQTLDNIEVLLVDDHGRDDSMELARRFVEAHPSGKTFRFLTTPHNMGPGPARNVGIEAAQGEYVAFVDNAWDCVPQRVTHRVQDSDIAIYRHKQCALQLTTNR